MLDEDTIAELEVDSENCADEVGLEVDAELELLWLVVPGPTPGLSENPIPKAIIRTTTIIPTTTPRPTARLDSIKGSQ
jgi:hypothetical protein